MEQNLFGNKQVLVTGASGLVGIHTVIALIKLNAIVHAFIRNDASKQRTLLLANNIDSSFTLENVIWHFGDISDYEDVFAATENIDYIFHCAGFVSFNNKDKENLNKTNILGTKNIVDAAIERKVLKLCHVSSVATVGKTLNSKTIDESSEFTFTKKKAAYHISKYYGEMEVWRGINEGLSAVIVNPSVIIGAGDWNTSSSALFGTIAKGMKYYTPGITGYVSVHDVVDCMILLMQSAISGERFILSAENIDYKTIFTSIANSIGIEPPKKEIKKWQVKLVAFISSIVLKNPKITKSTVKSAFSKTYYSSKKIQEMLPFTFRKISDEIIAVGAIYKKQQA